MEKYLALKASAGSGKICTNVRYITLLLLGANQRDFNFDFYKKAAAEMSQRF